MFTLSAALSSAAAAFAWTLVRVVPLTGLAAAFAAQAGPDDDMTAMVQATAVMAAACDIRGDTKIS